MIDSRRLRSGYSNLGPVQIPPLPQAIVLTDRGDGSKWMISFNTSAPERLSIVSDYASIQQREGVRNYSADDGPKMDEDGEFTLIIRNGRLGFEYNTFSRGITARDDGKPYARSGNDLRLLIMDVIDTSLVHIGTR